MPFRFPKTARLTRTSEFRRVREGGKSFTGRFMVLNVLRSDDPAGATRFGVITSRRLGNAVTRNRVRRRLRELARLTRPQLVSGLWLVLVARKSAVGAAFAELRQEWLRLAERGSILPAP